MSAKLLPLEFAKGELKMVEKFNVAIGEEQELTSEQKATNEITLLHILEVRRLLSYCRADLERRGKEHDQSKLRNPEVQTFTEYTPKLKEAEYGSEEYKGFLKGMAPALEHHYANNSHHPEHYENGIDGMNLLDVLEMLVDWKASTLRTKGGDIRKSLEIQRKRFGISDQLMKILENTLPLIEQ